MFKRLILITQLINLDAKDVQRSRKFSQLIGGKIQICLKVMDVKNWGKMSCPHPLLMPSFGPVGLSRNYNFSASPPGYKAFQYFLMLWYSIVQISPRLTMQQRTTYFFQAAGIVSGLPYAFIIFIMCFSTWRAVNVAAGDLDPFGPTFKIGLFDCWGAHPMKNLSDEISNILRLNMKFWLNIIMAPITVAKVNSRYEKIHFQLHIFKKTSTWFHMMIILDSSFYFI